MFAPLQSYLGFEMTTRYHSILYSNFYDVISLLSFEITVKHQNPLHEITKTQKPRRHFKTGFQNCAGNKMQK